MTEGGNNSYPMVGAGGKQSLRPSREFATVAASTVVLVVVCAIFAPSALAYGALSGSLPFAAILAIVGMGQMLVVQQGGFDLSVPGGVSLAVVIASHYPAGNDGLLLPAVGLALVCAILAGIGNGILIGIVRLNAIIATIGMNALLYAGVFAVSGGVPRITTKLLAAIATGEVYGVGNTILYALVLLALVWFVMKRSVAGRRFEAIGANPLASRAIGLSVKTHQMMAYVMAQLLYCTAGLLIAGITTQPTAFQGDSLLLPSVAVVVLGGTSLLGGRGFPVSTVVAAFFLTLLSQFALSVGLPYSAQTIIQAFALGFGIAVYSLRWSGLTTLITSSREVKG